jgi:DNA-binding response OmpR family regulator
MKILIVENEPTNLEVMTLAMEMEGMDVFPLISAKGFIPKVTAIGPDLVLLDIELDGFDGRELCRLLKRTDGINHIPVIIVSACIGAKVQSSFGYGADRVITKPFDLVELIREVKSLVRK